MVSSLWPPAVMGGAELYAAELAAHLHRHHWEVGVLTLGVDGADVVARVRPWPYRLDEYASQPAATRGLFHLADLYRPSTRRALEDAVARFRPDVVHTHSVQGLSSAALSGPSALGVPHVHTLHDYWLLCQRTSLTRRDGTPCDRRCGSCAVISRIRNEIIQRHPPDIVIAVSHALAREHSSIRWMQGRTRVIHNPVEIRAPHHGPHRTLTFGYLGQLVTTKGVGTLIAAFGRADIPGARLLVAGEGPLRAELELRAPAGVEFLGRVSGERREHFFDAIDCLVVPSEWKDPAPLVVNEARSGGLPVIGADIGGIPELIAPASRSLLFPPRDVGALVERLERFARAGASYLDHDDGSRSGLPTWDEHLDLVVGAYRDAAAVKAGGAVARQHG